MEESTRPAGADDQDVLRRLAGAARADLDGKRGGDVVDRLDPHRDDPGDHLIDALGDNDATVLLGTIDETPVAYGYLTVARVADGSLHAVIEELFVEPEARGVGVGEALVGELLENARARGAVAVQSTALPGDRATKNFFESQGMVARAILVHRWLDGR
ncbi:MAG: GNAT family N-acetyltransferase [Actinomycetota bacterium]|nr:GNAT family N-acetyltransferase [Actinomycetota bacterium]MEC9424719.1 GNAT family N-acetyltransferase [Actinomycetota bacterium]